MPESVEDIQEKAWTDGGAVPDYVRETISEAIDSGAVFDRFESVADEVGQRFREVREGIEDILEDNLTDPEGWSLDGVTDDLQEEFPSLSDGQAETVARSESASVLNTAREEGYEQRDDSHEYYYKWVGPDDSRTTVACERMKERTNPDFGGTPLQMNDLVRMEREIQNEEFPELEFRKHMLHINERHTFRRVLPHELNRLDDVEGDVSLSADSTDKPGPWVEETTVSKDLPDWVFEEIDESRFIPPEGAAEEIRQALEWIEEHGRDEAEGATQEGIARGRQILRHVEDGEPLTDTNDEGTLYVVEIANFFNRHRDHRDIAEEYEGEPWKDNGYLSWLLWGGDPADSWANGLKDRLKDIGYLKANHEHIALDDYLGLVEKMAATCGRTRRQREVEEALGEPLPRVLNRLLAEHSGKKRPVLRDLNDLLDAEGMESKVSSATVYSWLDGFRLSDRDYSTY
jgi:hypothetical protein